MLSDIRLLSILSCSVELILKTVVTLFTTLAGAFAGAWAAFHYQEHRESKQLEERNVAAVHRALYTIYNLWNIQHQYQVEIIDDYRGKPDAWLNMQATPPIRHGLTSFQAEDLSFLLQTSHAQTYAELVLEENRYQIAMSLIEMRSSVALNEAWPRLAMANVHVGATMNENRVSQIVGVDVKQKLLKLTENIVKHIDENEKSLRCIHDKLQIAFKDLYPDREVVQIEFT